jgi:hypothetical protein
MTVGTCLVGFLPVHPAGSHNRAAVLTYRYNAQSSVMRHHLDYGSAAPTPLGRCRNDLEFATQNKASSARRCRSYPALLSSHPDRSLRQPSISYRVFGRKPSVEKRFVVAMSLGKFIEMEVHPGLTGIGASTGRDDQRAARLWAENQQIALAAWRLHKGCIEAAWRLFGHLRLSHA